MLTARKMFSVIFTASAVDVDETFTTFSTTEEKNDCTRKAASAPSPDTTFGILTVLNTGLPGSSRSGEKPKKKSSPERKPVDCRIGLTTSSVVPGQVVDSRTISWPRRRYLAIVRVVVST